MAMAPFPSVEMLANLVAVLLRHLHTVSLTPFVVRNSHWTPYLRINGWYGVFSSVCEHGTLGVGIFHLHHETPWNSCALFNSGNRLKVFVLLRKEMHIPNLKHTLQMRL